VRVALSAAAVGALLLVIIALAVMAVIQARRRGRLDRLLAERGELSAGVPADRAAVLRSRSRVSQGRGKPPARRGRVAVVATVVALLACAVALGAWRWLDSRSSPPATAAKARAAARPRVLPPDPQTVVPSRPPPLAGGTTRYTVGVLNGTGVPGAARLRMVPLVRSLGFRVGRIDDAPVSRLSKSIVMWAPGKRVVALNVAHDLKVSRVSPIDGVPRELVGGADAVLVVGSDLLQGP
jgi:HAMP domain-containing protein